MSVVTASINEFVDWALGIVTIMIIYYIVKFFVVGGETEEELKRRRESVKEFLKERSNKAAEKKAADEKKKVAEEKKKAAESKIKVKKEKIKKKKSKVDKLVSKVNRLSNHLLGTATALNKVRGFLKEGKQKKAKKFFKEAESLMDRAAGSSVLEDMAKTTGNKTHLDQAKYLRSKIVEAREKLSDLKLNDQNLRKFNQYLGSIVKYVADFMGMVYGFVESEENKATSVKKESAKRQRQEATKKAVGAKRVGRVIYK